MQEICMKNFYSDEAAIDNRHLFLTGWFWHVLTMALEHSVQLPQCAAPEYFLGISVLLSYSHGNGSWSLIV